MSILKALQKKQTEQQAEQETAVENPNLSANVVSFEKNNRRVNSPDLFGNQEIKIRKPTTTALAFNGPAGSLVGTPLAD